MRHEAFLKTKISLLGALRFGGGRFFVWDDGEGDSGGSGVTLCVTPVSPAGSVFGGSGVTLCVTPGLACGLGHSAGLKAPRAFIQDRGAASLPLPYGVVERRGTEKKKHPIRKIRTERFSSF